MSLDLLLLLADPEYRPECGYCGPTTINYRRDTGDMENDVAARPRMERHESGDYNVCPKCKRQYYLNGQRRDERDVFYTVDNKGFYHRIDLPRYWIFNDGQNKTLSQAHSSLAMVRRQMTRKSILILPELKARG